MEEQQTTQAVAAEVATTAAPESGNEGAAKIRQFIDQHVTDSAPADAVQPRQDETTQETAPSTEEPAPFVVTDKIRAAAKFLDYSDEQIEAIDEREAELVERMARKARARFSALGREAKAQAKAETPAEEGSDSAEVEQMRLSSDDYPEELVKPFNKLVDTVIELQRREAQREQHQKGSVEKQVAKEVETFFSSLDVETFPQFSEGPSSESGQRLVKAARRIMELHEEEGEEATTAECLEEALAIVAKKEYAKSLTEKAASASRARSARSLARPSGQASPPKAADPREQGGKKIREFMTTAGLV